MNNSPPIELSILIVCYNSKKDIDRCLISVAKYTSGVTYEILLINNANDQLESHIQSEFPDVKIIENQENLGFAGGNNVLAQHASGKKLLLLNPDTELTSNAIEQLYRVSVNKPEYAAWGGVTYFASGAQEYSSAQVMPSLINEFATLLGLGRLVRNKPEVEGLGWISPVLSGAFMIVDTQDWQKVGGFDDSFFLYSEEVDLCYRLSLIKSAKPLMCQNASVIHYVGGSSSNASRTVWLLKGKMHFEKKHFPQWHNILMLGILYSWVASRYLIGTLVKRTARTKKGYELSERFSSAFHDMSGWRNGYY